MKIQQATAPCANHDWAAQPCPERLSARDVDKGYRYCRGCRERLLAVSIEPAAATLTARLLVWGIE